MTLQLLIPTLLLALLAPAGDQPAQGDKWKELAPKGGGFSVQVPGDAAE